jgi:hypothetical protein
MGNNDHYTIFYSWQSWLPNGTNRSLIEDALEIAVKNISREDTISVEPRITIDKDTANVPGAPDIARTILAKIERAAVFVCDVSLIGQIDTERATPNPNVLVELGYALKALGEGRVILVMNTAYGEPTLLPFDLKMKRVLTYHLDKDSADKVAVRNQIASALAASIRSIISDLDAQQKQVAAEAVLSPTSTADVATFADKLLSDLDVLAPGSGGEPDEILVQSLSGTTTVVAEFVSFVQLAVKQDATPAISAIYQGFEKLLGNYYSSQLLSQQSDFYRFMGHELFVSFIHCLIARERWELVADLLEVPLYVERGREGGPAMHSYERLSDYVQLLYTRNRRLGGHRASIHADMLKERHTEGELGSLVPFKQFMEADYFLFLRSVFQTPMPSISDQWTPWSNLYILDNPPPYLVRAEYKPYAERLLRPLGLQSLQQFRELLGERGNTVEGHFERSTAVVRPLGRVRVDKIGSK